MSGPYHHDLYHKQNGIKELEKDCLALNGTKRVQSKNIVQDEAYQYC
jgi:hypothetical protein